MPFTITVDVVLPPQSALPGTVWRNVMIGIEVALQGAIKRRIVDAMQKRVANWEISISFRGTYRTIGGAPGSITIIPFGSGRERWEWVSRGVHGHLITPRNAPSLTIRTGFQRKTAPGNIYGRAGGYAPPSQWRRKAYVSWGGIAPRQFEENIILDEEDWVVDWIEQTIVRNLSG